MDILFMDIDGVFNTQKSRERHYAQHGNLDCILPEKLELLSPLFRGRERLHIVLSSDWRLYFSIDQMREKLDGHGFMWANRLIDSTRASRDIDCMREPRGRQIHDWLLTHDVEHFAIIDDYADMAPYNRHLVQTSDLTGLLPKHVRKLHEVLTIHKRMA